MKNIRHKLCQLIIKKYVKDQINWPREIKIAQKLLKKFNSFKFWNNLQDFKNPLPSLAWFLKNEGKAFLLKEYEKFNFKLNNNEIKLEKDKVSKDKNIIKKPKNIIEFIKQ